MIVIKLFLLIYIICVLLAYGMAMAYIEKTYPYDFISEFEITNIETMFESLFGPVAVGYYIKHMDYSFKRHGLRYGRFRWN